MNDVLAIAFSLSKDWSYKAKKSAIDLSISFDHLVSDSRKKFESLDLKSAEVQVQKLQKQNGWLWIYGNPDYPKALSSIPNPPLVVYGLGQKIIDEENLLAFVGTRRPTPHGKRVGLLLANELIQEGLTLVSGLARGIDSLAHRASIEAKVPTIAVVAHGLEAIFPPENKNMRDDILATGGTVISEYPFGIKSLAAYFPQRNRIISGLCKGTLVIEASESSGTKHTVNHALDQAREVFAVPGPIDSEYSVYPNELIFNGANMVRTSADILSFYPNRQKRLVVNQKQDFKPTKLQRQILEFFNRDSPKTIDEFLEITAYKPREAIQSLTELELYGRVIKNPDATYLLV